MHILMHFLHNLPVFCRLFLTHLSLFRYTMKEVLIMLISLDKLKKCDFMLGGISAIFRAANTLQWQVQNRNKTSLLLISKGRCRITSPDGTFFAEEGALLYLPKGSYHRFQIINAPLEYYEVNFQISVNGEPAQFSQYPIKLVEQTSPDCLEAFQNLAETDYSEDNTIAKCSMLCTIFLSLQYTQENQRRKQLSPAIRRIRSQLMQDPVTERFCASELAALCNLSTAQFYHLFHAEYGITPLDYHNNLLLRKAELLLETHQYTVTEVATALGFEDPAYFSRFFKKHKGVPPSSLISKQN